MQRIISILLILFSFQLYAQKGTIKVAKPEEKKIRDSVVTPPSRPKIIVVLPEVGINYTFKENDKIGYEGGLHFMFSPWSYSRAYVAGVKYSLEHQYFHVSPFNLQTGMPDTENLKSQARLEYLKLPLDMRYVFAVGPQARFVIDLGVEAKHLLKVDNERLGLEDYNRYNLSGRIGVGFRVNRRRRVAISIRYTNDFLENLPPL